MEVELIRPCFDLDKREWGGSFTALPPERAGAGGSGAEEAGTQVVGPPKSTDHRLQVVPVY